MSLILPMDHSHEVICREHLRFSTGYRKDLGILQIETDERNAVALLEKRDAKVWTNTADIKDHYVGTESDQLLDGIRRAGLHSYYL